MNDCARDQILIDSATAIRMQADKLELHKRSISTADLADHLWRLEREISSLLPALTSARKQEELESLLALVPEDALERALKERRKKP